MEKIRTAVVGAGNWGRQHARAFSEHPLFELCAVAGRTLERAQRRGAEFGVPGYNDIEQMLASEKPDFVSLSLPNQEHYAPTLQVIRAGFPLLVEKPLTFDLAEADLLLSEASARSLFFAINFNHRYAHPAQMAKTAIEEGRLGEIVFASWRFGGEGGAGHPFANLIETQCHGFDLLEFLCGKIDSVSAEMTDMTGKGYSTHAISLRFVNGAVGSLIGSYDSSYAYRETQRVEINGTQGRILMEDTVLGYSIQAAGDEMAQTWRAGYFNDPAREFHRTFDRHLDGIGRAFLDGEAPPIPASAGRRALALAHASIESFRAGKRVFVPD